MSCGENTASKIALETNEGIVGLKSLIEKEFGLDKKAHTLSISMKGRTSSDIDQITIFFTENNKDGMWFYSMSTAQLLKPEPTDSTEPEVKMKALSEFTIEAIPSYYDQAIAMIEKETNEFTNFRINSYDLNIEKNPNTITHRFTLLADKTDNKTSYYGTRLEGNVFSFKFATDENGTLKCSKGLDAF
ncbi:hypothetical protein [uncultured Winogradskyella sp.]|uniref:hypothetical protein n=1 Tax=uncultured Winogradskyella sp. TaxID=395353 RepID=UPI00262956FB|nr:hypothetical protein [uncultured Winogradskyella sp.]